MKQLVLSVLCCAAVSLAQAQSTEAPYSLKSTGCATRTTDAEIQRIYDFVQHNPAAFTVKKTNNAVDTIPLTVHVIGTDAGGGYYKMDDMFKLLCQLNTRYAPVGFYFAMNWPVLHHDNDAWYIHDFANGGDMMQQNNVANTVNVYFVQDPAGNCGYFSPSDNGVAIAKSCAQDESTTLTHELGHFFGLAHTFYGWEGGNMPANPEKVTRGAGANCNSAGDGFCDTDADFISDRWQCPYADNLTDQTGTPYHPDSSIYMSYSYDACQSRFSNQQVAAMQNDLSNYRSNLQGNTFITWTALQAPQVVFPVDSVYTNSQKITWNKVAGAEYYYVRITPKLATGLLKQEALTADTSLDINFAMPVNGAYRVTIAPLSSVNLCRAAFASQDFVNSGNVSSLDVQRLNGSGASGISVVPNPAARQVNVMAGNLAPGAYQLSVTSISGQQLFTQSFNTPGGSRQIAIDAAAFANGLYFVTLSGKDGQWNQKLVVQH